MKYLDIEIRCNQINDRFLARAKIKKMHRDANCVKLRLDEKLGNEYPFSIVANWDKRLLLGPTWLKLPVITERIEIPMMDIPETIGLSGECLFSKMYIHKFFYKILMSLYLWDKRCSRSINVKDKLEEDIPMKIIWNNEEFSLMLKQMEAFAEYIKQ